MFPLNGHILGEAWRPRNRTRRGPRDPRVHPAWRSL